MSISDYRKLQGDGQSFVEKLLMNDPTDVEFERSELGLRIPEF